MNNDSINTSDNICQNALNIEKSHLSQTFLDDIKKIENERKTGIYRKIQSTQYNISSEGEKNNLNINNGQCTINNKEKIVNNNNKHNNIDLSKNNIDAPCNDNSQDTKNGNNLPSNEIECDSANPSFTDANSISNNQTNSSNYKNISNSSNINEYKIHNSSYIASQSTVNKNHFVQFLIRKRSFFVSIFVVIIAIILCCGIMEMLNKQKLIQSTTTKYNDDLISIDLNGDPLIELDRLYLSTNSPNMRNNLDQFKKLIIKSKELNSHKNNPDLIYILKSYISESDLIPNIAFRCYQIQFAMNIARDSNSQMFKKSEHKFTLEINKCYDTLKLATKFYLSNVFEISKYHQKDVDNTVNMLVNEYKLKDNVIHSHFIRNLRIFAKHVEYARENNLKKLAYNKLWDELIIEKNTRTFLKSIGDKF